MNLLDTALLTVVAATIVGVFSSNDVLAEPPKLYSELTKFVQQRESEFDRISSERKVQLEQLSDYLRQFRDSGIPCAPAFRVHPQFTPQPHVSALGSGRGCTL